MFSRYFLTFCLLATFLAFVAASVEDSEAKPEFDDPSLSIEERSKFVSIIYSKIFNSYSNEHEKLLLLILYQSSKLEYKP